jgi:hypothetical protein
MELKIAHPDAMRGESGRTKNDIVADRLAPVPPAKLDAPRPAPEAARTKQGQALDQERDRADALARELTSLRAELDAARIVGSEEAVQAAAAEIKQMRALAEERDRADGLARELTSLQAELDAARNKGPEVKQAATAEAEQKRALKQDGDRAEALARELTSLRAELETSRAASLEAVRTAEAATVKQTQAFEKERDRTGTLTSELASTRKEAEEQSARLAAAHAEVLQATEKNKAIAAGQNEQKLALASEHDRADALARELTSVRNELEASNRQIAVSKAPVAVRSCEPVVDRSQQRIAASSSHKNEGEGRPPAQISGETAVANLEGSSASDLPHPPLQSAAHQAVSDLDPNVAVTTERSASANATSPSPINEHRLLARANALLQQADISGARPLLEHAIERGSARAAFMLAETYDARVLQSWGARGISGDLTKARELYQQAEAGGIEDAKQRIEFLK